MQVVVSASWRACSTMMAAGTPWALAWWRNLPPIPVHPRLRTRQRQIRHSTNVHRLVLIAHGGPPPSPKSHTRHLDADLQCPNYYNPRTQLPRLCWGTISDNCQDSILMGRWTRGEKNGMAKLTPYEVLEMRRYGSRKVPANDAWLRSSRCVAAGCRRFLLARLGLVFRPRD